MQAEHRATLVVTSLTFNAANLVLQWASRVTLQHADTHVQSQGKLVWHVPLGVCMCA